MKDVVRICGSLRAFIASCVYFSDDNGKSIIQVNISARWYVYIYIATYINVATSSHWYTIILFCHIISLTAEKETKKLYVVGMKLHIPQYECIFFSLTSVACIYCPYKKRKKDTHLFCFTWRSALRFWLILNLRNHHIAFHFVFPLAFEIWKRWFKLSQTYPALRWSLTSQFTIWCTPCILLLSLCFLLLPWWPTLIYSDYCLCIYSTFNFVY